MSFSQRVLGALSVLVLCGSVVLGAGGAGANVPTPLVWNTQAPAVQSAEPDTIVTFEAVAETIGIDLSTQAALWEVSTDRGATWTRLPNSQQNSTNCAAPGSSELCSQLSRFAELPDNEHMFRVVWTWLVQCGVKWCYASHASQAAVLFVGTGERTVTITKNPVDVTVAAGHSARFTATATGNPNPVVQWYSLPPGTDTWVAVPGASGRSTALVVPAASAVNGTKYEAYFLNWLAAGTPYQSPSSASTTAATLTVAG